MSVTSLQVFEVESASCDLKSAQDVMGPAGWMSRNAYREVILLPVTGPHFYIVVEHADDAPKVASWLYTHFVIFSTMQLRLDFDWVKNQPADKVAAHIGLLMAAG